MIQLLQDSYISYVNLPHRTDRLQHIQSELERIGLKAEKTNGIYPHEFDVNDSRHQTMRNRTVGAIGCYTSQLNIMKKAFSLNKHAFVMEDDIVLASDFWKRMEYISNWSLSNPFAVFWLGGTFHVGGNRGPYWHTNTIGRDIELTNDSRIVKCYGAFSTHCYIVHRDYLEQVIKRLEEFMPQSIGIDYSFIKHVEPFLPTYAFVPGTAKQIDNISDQVPGKNNITEFSKFANLNGTIENSAYWWQDKMEDFDPTQFYWAEAKVK